MKFARIAVRDVFNEIWTKQSCDHEILLELLYGTHLTKYEQNKVAMIKFAYNCHTGRIQRYMDNIKL